MRFLQLSSIILVAAATVHASVVNAAPFGEASSQLQFDGLDPRSLEPADVIQRREAEPGFFRNTFNKIKAAGHGAVDGFKNGGKGSVDPQAQAYTAEGTVMRREAEAEANPGFFHNTFDKIKAAGHGAVQAFKGAGKGSADPQPQAYAAEGTVMRREAEAEAEADPGFFHDTFDKVKAAGHGAAAAFRNGGTAPVEAQAYAV